MIQNSNLSGPELLSLTEAAAYLKVSESYFKALVYRDCFTIYKLGKRNHFDKSELDRYIEKQAFVWSSVNVRHRLPSIQEDSSPEEVSNDEK